MPIFRTCILFTNFYQNDQVNENEIGRTPSTRGYVKEYIQGFGEKSRTKETTGKTEM
jgi:hypothetical protein